MIATIAVIAIFQAYWLVRLFNDEKQGLKKEADLLFRDAIYQMQMNKFREDSLFNRIMPQNILVVDAVNMMRRTAAQQPGNKMVISMSSSYSRTREDGSKDSVVFVKPEERIVPGKNPGDIGKFIFRSSLGDSLSAQEIDSAYRLELRKAKLDIDFEIISKQVTGHPRRFVDSVPASQMATGFVPVGLSHPVVYQALLKDTFNHTLGRITYPVLVSVMLITITIVSFIFLYRNLLAQRRLAALKNDFISNITHELKTPIATVNVAIEALKNFNAIDDPARTKEYLDISSAELQRLSLLVDKVLKLSLFENREIDLKKETFDLRQLTEEVIKTMQLQVQKRKALLSFEANGTDFRTHADKLHITSVVYNLIDNALKYSPDNPNIMVRLVEQRSSIRLSITDNGIGIPSEYIPRIFDKFFRVPHGNMHNIKGYGLGLSYVHHVIERHEGTIEVESQEGKGTTFIIHLMKEPGNSHQPL